MRPARFIHLSCWVLLIGAAAAQSGGLLSKPRNPQRVTVVEIPEVKLTAGLAEKVTLRFRVEDGYHVNSSLPSSDLLIPTVLDLQPAPPLKFGKASYSPGKLVAFPFAPDEKLSVYEGEFTVTAVISAPRAAKPGEYVLSGMLKYQACSNNACFPPNEVPVELKVNVAPAKQKLKAKS